MHPNCAFYWVDGYWFLPDLQACSRTEIPIPTRSPGMAHLNFMVNFPDIRVNLRDWFTEFASKQCRYFFHTLESGDSTVHLFQLRTRENANMPTCNRLLMSRFSNLFWEMSWLGNVMAHVVVRVG